MKTYLLSISFFLLLPIVAKAQQPGVDVALQHGSASELAAFFAKSVDLLLVSDESSVSSTQASALMADFFSKNAVKGYKLNHVSDSQNGRPPYTIGDLYTASGTFRISVFYDASKKISEIRIEK